MAKFQEGKEKTIDDVIKELGLEEVHYDGDDFDEDPDKDFKDPYEETYNRLKKNINKRNEQKDRDSLRSAARRENANREVMRDIDRAAKKKAEERVSLALRSDGLEEASDFILKDDDEGKNAHANEFVEDCAEKFHL